MTKLLSRICFSTPKKILSKCYSSKKINAENKQNKYSNTILLPKTTFPLRISGEKRIKNDNLINENCRITGLYEWQRENLEGPDFILHDGPPYANGVPHMGHAINKILKDIILRFKVLTGTRVHYVPGWDCHGLPIELKALGDTQEKPSTIRQKARTFAENAVYEQKEAFKCWGVMADWEKGCYVTNSKDYVKNQLQVFYQLYEKGLIYRDLKPVFWSPSTRTALAEAELVYNPSHKSLSTLVKFELTNLNLPPNQQKLWKKLYALVWTTTPWTLPANKAICFNPKLEYSIVSTNNDYFLFCIEAFESSELNIDPYWEITRFSGEILQDAQYIHPVNQEVLPFLPGEHVSASKGTGLVHTAPTHGHDDFLVALKYKLSLDSIVDEAGKYTDKAGPGLEGLKVLEEADPIISKLYAQSIVSQNDFIHSYPYDWRTNKPVIIKASQQWFIDTDKIKDQAINCLNEVHIHPQKTADSFRKAMVEKLKRRPYWCISRQRVWGVPIPVFYDKKSFQPHISKAFIDHLCNIVDEYGLDYWWSGSIHEIVPPNILQNLKYDQIVLGKDILDIWFDSGISWSKVMESNQIADLYLEGVDQITGWFQSSLLTSVALHNRAPYTNIYVNGFVVDDKGRKMSKSIGNVVNPQDIIYGKKNSPAYGVDVLRWWVAAHGTDDSKISFKENALQSSAETVQKIRSVLRFLLSNLYDFNPNEVLITQNQLKIIDRYFLHLLQENCAIVLDNYENYQFTRATNSIKNFVINTVSAMYCSIVKNRLYCEVPDSPGRRSAQYVLYQALKTLCICLAPILPHLTEELNMHMPEGLKSESVFKNRVDIDPSWCDPNLISPMKYIMEVKAEVNRLSQNYNSSGMDLTVYAPQADLSKLMILQKESVSVDSELVDILQVAKVVLMDQHDLDNNCSKILTIDLKSTSFHQCERCRRFNCDFVNSICNKCTECITLLKEVNYARK